MMVQTVNMDNVQVVNADDPLRFLLEGVRDGRLSVEAALPMVREAVRSEPRTNWSGTGHVNPSVGHVAQGTVMIDGIPTYWLGKNPFMAGS